MVIFYHTFKKQDGYGRDQHNYRRAQVEHPIDGNFANKDIPQSTSAQRGDKWNNKNPKNIESFFHRGKGTRNAKRGSADNFNNSERFQYLFGFSVTMLIYKSEKFSYYSNLTTW